MIMFQAAFCQYTLSDSIVTSFKEIKVATKANENIWGKDLYGPILIVNAATRKLYANESDSAGVLKMENGVYSGILPININIANTSVRWNGKDWAMIILPLPRIKKDRINFLAHELFHRAQPSLGFKLFNIDNNHLDKKDGRIYLRLELVALQNALTSANIKEMRKHLTNAFVFRKYRQSLFPGADNSENLLELNEGIAEYTGMIISNRTKPGAIDHFIKSIDQFFNNPTFVRSFAYQTIPVYGYLLRKEKKFWNTDITLKTNLVNYFINAFKITMPVDLKQEAIKIADTYNAVVINAEESGREERINKLIAGYKSIFVDQPHFEINFEQMNISFDPGNIMPVEDKGTYYPNLRITDKWGILTVQNGALISPMWNKVSLSNPIKFDDKNITGNGWTLQISDGYILSKDNNTGNYKLSKKQ